MKKITHSILKAMPAFYQNYPNNKADKKQKTKNICKRKSVSLFISLTIIIFFSTNVFSQAILTHTSDADFNKGYINNMLVTGGNVILPNQASGMGSWITTTTLPKQLRDQKLTLWDNRIYLTGGYNPSSGYSNSVYMASASAGIGSWTTLASLPVGVCDHAVVAANGFLFVIGGHQDGAPFSEIYYAKFKTNGTLEEWQISTVSLPQPLWGHTASYVDGHIYVAGGSNQAEKGTALNTVYSITLNPKDDLVSITVLPNTLPAPRNQHSMVVYGKYMYILGGYDNTNQNSNTTYYCQADNAGGTSVWQAADTLPQPVYGHSSTCYNGIITIMGGYYSTDTIPSNSNYYANVDSAFNFIWTPFFSYPQYRANGEALAINGRIFYLGGEDIFLNVLNNCFYSNLSLSSNKVQDGRYISPVFDLGDNRQITELSYQGSNMGDYNIYYRYADNGGIWSSWVDGAQINPIPLSLNKRYCQYMFLFESGDINNSVSLHSVSLEFTATQVCGTISGTLNWTKANSPYIATCDIFLSSGTLTIDAGVEVLFVNETGFEIGQANLLCNGAVDDSIKFTSFDGGSGIWEGIYFNSNSDNGVASAITYTIIENAGFGSRNANLYCSSTSQPTLTNCFFKQSEGHGAHLYYSSPTFNQCIFENNTSAGLYCNYSSPTITYSKIENNESHGVLLSSSSPQIWNSEIKDNTEYAIYCANPNSFPGILGNTYSGNIYNAVVYAGGDMNTSGTWYNDGIDYIVLSDIIIWNSPNPRLTIQPGVTCRFETGIELQIGSGGYAGELYATGTAGNQIVFTSLNDSIGGWNGIFFDNASDANGATSNLQYCIIEKGNQYNISCYYTTQPATINNCTIQNSAIHGLKFDNSTISVDNCLIENNLSSGIYCNNSAPIVTYSAIQNNGSHGFSLSTSSPQIYDNEIINNTEYAIYCANPNSFPNISGNTYSGNYYDAVVYAGGDMNINGTWYSDGCDYIAIGEIKVGKYGDKCRLTVEPGINCKFIAGLGLQIGWSPYGAELYAIGTSDSLITFTPFDDNIGGWEGIYFDNYSDEYGATSNLQYCVIEKGNQYNMYCYYTVQPTMNNCIIKNSADEGIYLQNSNITIDNCTMENNTDEGVLCNNSSPEITNSTIQNNGSHGFSLSSSSPHIYDNEILNNTEYAIYCSNPISFPNISGNTYSGNYYDAVVYAGGDMNTNGTWYSDNCDYIVIGEIKVGKYGDKCRLTIEPGINCKFIAGVELQIGWYPYGAELYAIGTSDSLITFTSLNDTIGGWEGIYFDDFSDSYSATSNLQYCVIEKGNQYNMYCYNTVQPTMSDCIIRNSADEGICLQNSNITIDNSTIENNVSHGFSLSSSSPQIWHNKIINNTEYAIYCVNPNSFPNIFGNTYSGNYYDAVVYAGGDMTSSGTWYFDNCDYIAIGGLRIGKNGNNCRLTIEPGINCKFEAGVGLQIGWYAYGGDLYAIGTPDSLITFAPTNDSIGGWEGIYFDDFSDSYGATSNLQYCVIEKGNQYNIYCYNTVQPTLERSLIVFSNNYGLQCNNSSPQLKNSQFIYNGSHGIYLTGSSQPTIGNTPELGCDIYFNDGYEVYNNTGNDINARYNFWKSTDPGYISSRIYDYYDDPAKGIVHFSDPDSVGLIIIPDKYHLCGDIVYDNTASTIMDSVDVYAMDYLRNIIDTTRSDEFGHFEFDSLYFGKYLFDIEPNIAWGGVNSTDALLIMQDFAQVSILTGVKEDAADVNWSHTVNATDALLVMKRYAAVINSFVVGDWLLGLDTLLIDGVTDTIHDFKALCYGDVNGSYTPPTKSDGTIMLEYDDVLAVNSFEEFELPVNVTEYLEVGAISLGLYYPENYLEVLDVTNDAGNIIWSAKEGMVRISWANLAPVYLNEEETMITLHLKSKDVSSLTEPIQIGLELNSELANGEASVLEDVVLSTSEIVGEVMGVMEYDTKGFYLSNNYPNPFTNKTTIQYTIPENGQVKLLVYDMFGKPIAELVNEAQTAGSYKIRFENAKLKAGVYFYKIEVKSKTGHFSKVKNMIITK
jgi:parallel beta-helix repeat protein